jgi:hypothetical protein
MSCDRMAGCGVLLDVLVFEAVRNDQCFGIGCQSALHKVHLITSLIAVLRQCLARYLRVLKGRKILGGHGRVRRLYNGRQVASMMEWARGVTDEWSAPGHHVPVTGLPAVGLS